MFPYKREQSFEQSFEDCLCKHANLIMNLDKLFQLMPPTESFCCDIFLNVHSVSFIETACVSVIDMHLNSFCLFVFVEKSTYQTIYKLC